MTLSAWDNGTFKSSPGKVTAVIYPYGNDVDSSRMAYIKFANDPAQEFYKVLSVDGVRDCTLTFDGNYVCSQGE